MPKIALPILASPIIRRVAWHIRRVGGQLDRRFFVSLGEGILAIVAIAAVLITLLEKPRTLESFFDSFNWGIATVLGQGNADFVTSPGGRVVGWLLILFGVAMLGMITGALVAMVIDFLLKEGQGLGSAGHKDHIIVCGWNSTARDLIDELKGDDYPQKVVVLADLDKNPAGAGVYFVRGDATNAEDLERAGIVDASAALVFPVDGSDEADMHSILTIMAIKAVAPTVRTVAEVNNPRHEPHFRRAALVDTLKGPGPFTVFAPTDEAFAKLPAGTVEELLKPENKEKLVAILTYHVVPGKVMAKDVMKMTSAKTVNGKSVTIMDQNGTVMVDNAKVVKADIAASNGVIHVIDSVILPQ